MLHFATIGLSCLMMLGTLGAAPCASLGNDGDLRYCDTIVYDENGGSNHTTEIIRRDYITREKTKYDLALMIPDFTFSPAVSSCAAVAGSNLIGFYDRYDENLIPNHKSGTLYGTAYCYSIQDDAVAELTRQLYDLMGTDETGTTEEQFVDGIKAFCKSKGKSVTTTSCMSSGSIDYSKAKTYIEANQPIVLFVSGYNVGFMSEDDHYDSVGYTISPANHVMVGFGYKECHYVTTTGNISDYFFNVASGLAIRPSGVYNINLKTRIIDALAVKIY